MSNIEGIVNALEQKITKVLQQLDELKANNSKLQQELFKSQQKVYQQEQIIQSWEDKYETLKIAKTMLGSDENKKETKLKINALIRDIDYCISQLSE